MSRHSTPATLVYLEKFTTQKVMGAGETRVSEMPDSLAAWIERYRSLAITGVRSAGVTDKITLHLARFVAFFVATYGHDRLTTCLRRDVIAWQTALHAQGLAPATINNHLASVSAFTTWVQTQAPRLFPAGDPAKGLSSGGRYCTSEHRP